MKETSRFYSSLGLLILLNAIVKPIWVFGIDRQVQNEVGAADYGSYFSILNLSIVLGFLLDLGLTNYYNRQLAAMDKNFISSAGSYIFLKLLLALIFGAIITVIALLSGMQRWDIVLLVILVQVLTSLFVFFRAIITSQQWFQTDAWFSVLDKFLMIIVCGIFLYIPSLFGYMNMDRFLLSQIGCTALAMLTAVVILLRRNFHFSFKKLLPASHVLKASLPFACVILLMSFHSRIDGFLLERIKGPEEAGKYAGAFRLLDASNMVGYLVASFLLPYIARNRGEKKNIENVVLNVRHLLIMFSITLSTMVIFLAPWIQRVLYHHTDPDSIEVLQWCLPEFIGYSMIQVYGCVMTATGHIVAFNYIIMASIVINLGINIFLIPSWGAKGCCLAALASQSFCGIATMWYVKQKLEIAVDFRSILIYIFITAIVCGVLYVSIDRQVSKWLVIAITGAVVLIMLRITKLIDPRIWRKTTLQ